ncbi:hypothetical protein E5720_04800 [Rhodococcus sp. PAMC28707]|uniref:hypothetical protein n=1 Tax=unclassified Rhodococcus (in: high G+C Gram-positive bacteria) TaxID=192944 RepID=UPI00109E2ECF|nr:MULTISPECIES: hypothetical protein [unclassified Rhodococcus (in: high G+C Gram-positive bacteria)]QCB50390.1 hypothetical protein E5769_09215 [Rhodococcus sp. PAMC28705]QCB57918.1 hypothetical protein E5720_04800 [Rhodococcus sp. PAMC28707]
MNQIRTLLRLDAVASGGLGVVLVALAEVLEDPLGLAVTLSVVVGLGLLAWTGFVTWVSAHPTPALVREVFVLNLVWVAASITFAIGGWGGLTGWGVLFVLAQALAVAALTALQYAARRELRTPLPV